MKVLLLVTSIHLLFLSLPLKRYVAEQLFTRGSSEHIQVKIISKGKGKSAPSTLREKAIGTHKEESHWELFHPAPSYPREALQKGWEGKVVVKIASDKKGNIFQKEIIKSSGFNILDNAAMSTLTKWKTLANLKGQKVPFIFKIKRKI